MIEFNAFRFYYYEMGIAVTPQRALRICRDKKLELEDKLDHKQRDIKTRDPYAQMMTTPTPLDKREVEVLEAGITFLGDVITAILEIPGFLDQPPNETVEAYFELLRRIECCILSMGVIPAEELLAMRRHPKFDDLYAAAAQLKQAMAATKGAASVNGLPKWMTMVAKALAEKYPFDIGEPQQPKIIIPDGPMIIDPSGR